MPPQGTRYWGFLRVWDDGTHEITIPAVKDASGCGADLESACQNDREKLVSVVKESVARGWPTNVLTRRQTAVEVKDDLTVIAEELSALGVDMPELKQSQMMRIHLDYSLAA